MGWIEVRKGPSLTGRTGGVEAWGSDDGVCVSL